MRICAHENFLSKDLAQYAAIVFELGMPAYFAAYRNATWTIFSKIGHPSKTKSSPAPDLLLKDLSQLQSYMDSRLEGVTLASSKKSFLQTHYKEQKMKVDIKYVLLPLAPVFSYFDDDPQVWLKDLDRPLTFQHLCGIHIPRSLQIVVKHESPHPRPSFDGLSSYDIEANQTECPANMSVEEFTSYHRLLAGKNSRWMTILVELGSSNINFSTEDALLTFSHLTLQAGPSVNEYGTLRDVHKAFKDPLFCRRLIEQVEFRFRNIESNWWESFCMELLVTIGLRLFALTSGADRQCATHFLDAARLATLRWTIQLRHEVRVARDTDSLKVFTRYGV